MAISKENFKQPLWRNNNVRVWSLKHACLQFTTKHWQWRGRCVDCLYRKFSQDTHVSQCMYFNIEPTRSRRACAVSVAAAGSYVALMATEQGVVTSVLAYTTSSLPAAPRGGGGCLAVLLRPYTRGWITTWWNCTIRSDWDAARKTMRRVLKRHIAPQPPSLH